MLATVPRETANVGDLSSRRRDLQPTPKRAAARVRGDARFTFAITDQQPHREVLSEVLRGLSGPADPPRRVDHHEQELALEGRDGGSIPLLQPACEVEVRDRETMELVDRIGLRRNTGCQVFRKTGSNDLERRPCRFGD